MIAQSDMDTADKALLNVLQSSFPLTQHPFAEIGRRLGIAEDATIKRIGVLKAKHVVREISAIFDTHRLGYNSSLVAMRFSPEALLQAAHHINRHPGVSHNYSRDNYFNLWFTLAVGPGSNLECEVMKLAEETQTCAWRVLPALRVYKIGVSFDMLSGEGACPSPSTLSPATRQLSAEPQPLTDMDKAAVRLLQQDLPLCPQPFEALAQGLGLSGKALVSKAASMQEQGIMRRYGAVLHHRRAGFKANGMAVWQVPQDQLELVGKTFAAHPSVSHCYQRPTFPDWPYSLFTMVHATTKEGCNGIIRSLGDSMGISRYQVLYSQTEFKKTRVRYFVE